MRTPIHGASPRHSQTLPTLLFRESKVSSGIALDLKGLACSTVAACSSGPVRTFSRYSGHRLKLQDALASIRFSLVRHKSTQQEISSAALASFPAGCRQLRELSPAYQNIGTGVDRPLGLFQCGGERSRRSCGCCSERFLIKYLFKIPRGINPLPKQLCRRRAHGTLLASGRLPRPASIRHRAVGPTPVSHSPESAKNLNGPMEPPWSDRNLGTNNKTQCPEP